MNKKIKALARGIFVLRVKKSFKYQALLVSLFVALFVFQASAQQEFPVLINEIYATDSNDWIELYNGGDYDIDLATEDFRLYKSVSSSPSLLMRIGNAADGSYPRGTMIKSKGYYLIVRDDASENIKDVADAICTKDSFTWGEDGYTLYLGNNAITNAHDPDIVDMVRFGYVDETDSAPKIVEDKSIGRLGGISTNDNSEDFSLQNPTPGEENEEFIEEEEEEEEAEEKEIPEPAKIYSDKIRLNELLPNPEKGDEEYIELYNAGSAQEDLFGWTLHDGSKSGEYKFAEHVIIGAQDFLVLLKNVFDFALNNSGKETVTLRDAAGKIVSEVSYSGSKKGVSYNSDGTVWRWSKFLTPGKENIFNSQPYGKIKIPKDVYEKVYADFSVGTGDADGDTVKVTWDFGDKHKSYLAKTRHKYLKKGTYNGSVKLSDGNEDVVHEFIIKVEEIPHPKVRITFVNANPKGSDTKNETITVENKSKKKINLNGWSIATGWKKFANHPIKEDVEIKKNKAKEITREVSSFTLNNKKDKIELRYPDGKVAYSVKYKKEDGIEEGEVYRKIKGGWEWYQSQKSIKFIKSIKQSVEIDITSNSSLVTENSVIKSSVSEMQEDVDSSLISEFPVTGSLVTEIPVEVEVENKFITLNNELVEIELLKVNPRVLGVESVREVDGQYLLTPEIPEQEHYAVVFLKSISLKMNSKLNSLLNYFFK